MEIIEIEWIQDRKQDEITWAVKSLDIVLGLVGGLSGILWSGLFLLFGGYESFKLENSLIGAVYSTFPQEGEDLDANEASAKRSMMKIVAERGKYFYNYSEYLLTSLMRCFCNCCCRSSAWY